MKRITYGLIALGMMMGLTGCPTPAPGPSPIVIPPSLSGVETVILMAGQYQLNAALSAGKISQAQYDAAESLLIKTYADAKNPGGVTQAMLDADFNQAIAEIVALALPIAPIPAPAAQAKEFVPQPLTVASKAKLAAVK